MQIIDKVGDDNIATVYIGKTKKGNLVEFVESVQPPIPREKKWVLIISILNGCPVGCPICDAGGWYKGELTKDEILEQIDYLVTNRFPDRKIPINKFKIQFARMGEPAFNSAVIDVLNEFSKTYQAPGFLPSVSTVAPIGCDNFFTKLLDTKNKYYADGNFQLQFSIHTSDEKLRDKIIPIKKWDFKKIAEYGKIFHAPGDKKISLNFALAKGAIFDAKTIRRYFNPEIFLIKITPINPTINSIKNNLKSYFIKNAGEDKLNIIPQLQALDFEVILSIGELQENKIGSNCGQYVTAYEKTTQSDQ
jgi:23S rRNA (adenine2503-C2)-methyltransferase